MRDLICDRVSKRYRVGARDFWALREISFDVGRGETFGIIGANGAGKSTILKLLSNITRPTSGQIRYYGRLSALIELGSGFHPELTGRENVMLSGAILGMKRREVREKLPRIIDFAGIGEFIDTPVKWYSSGMYVRLGFSIAAHLSPDILLIDEVLAVGDAAFQRKCLDRIESLKQAGTTILFVSHDLAAVQQLCDRVLLLQKGCAIACGDPAGITRAYLRAVAEEHTIVPADVSVGEIARGRARIRRIVISDAQNRHDAEIRTGDPIRVRVEYEAFEPLDDLVFDVFYFTQDGAVLMCQTSTAYGGHPIDVPPGPGFVQFDTADVPLQPGTYAVGALIKPRAGAAALDWSYGDTVLRVAPGKMTRGHFHMPADWQVHHANASLAAASSGGAQWPKTAR